MRMIFVPILSVLALSFAADGASAANCAISDSAICAADPNCHWDVDKRGCEEGPAPFVDACAAHSSEDICKADATLGCAWDADKKACHAEGK